MLQVKPGGQAEWEYPVKPAWKFIRVRTEFRVENLKPGPESYQNARVMIRFDEKPDGGKHWYGASPALTKDCDWQTQEFSRMSRRRRRAGGGAGRFRGGGNDGDPQADVETLGEEGRRADEVAGNSRRA